MFGSLRHGALRALVTMGVLGTSIALAPAMPASAAETRTQTVTIDVSNTRSGLTTGGPFTFIEVNPTFNQFNPASGTLVSATLSWDIDGSVNGSGNFAGTGTLSYAGQSQVRTFDTVSNPGPKAFDFTGTVAAPGAVQGTGTFTPSTLLGTISHSGFFPWGGEMSATGTVTLVYEFTPAGQDTTPPLWSNVPSAITAEATGPSGAPVSYVAPTATDDVGVTSQACAPPSGATFALGTTTVICTASDAAGNTATASFTVTVADTVAPVYGAAANVTTDATSPAGAVVGFSTPTATDVVGVTSNVCTPASGSTFAIGTTTVTCSASDAARNTATTSFSVTVRSANDQLSSLRALVANLNPPPRLGNSLNAQLRAAHNSSAGGDTLGACESLQSFSDHVRAQSGKAIPSAQADALIGSASQIRAVIGC